MSKTDPGGAGMIVIPAEGRTPLERPRSSRMPAGLLSAGTTTLALALSLALAPAAAHAQAIDLREQDGLAWACGGIGYEERESLRALEPRVNVILLFVAGERGGLIADVALRVIAAHNPELGLDIIAPGPICVMRLPAGSWTIEARHGGVSRSRAITLAASAPSLARVQITFPAETGDTLRTSPEESSRVKDWGRVGR